MKRGEGGLYNIVFAAFFSSKKRRLMSGLEQLPENPIIRNRRACYSLCKRANA
jgi:hypothetical protein